MKPFLNSLFSLIILVVFSNNLQAQLTVDESDSTKIFTTVDQAPEYPGGLPALYNFIGKQVTYPISAKDSGISGIVFVQFIVTETGDVDTNRIEILKGVHPLLDAEVIRVVKLFPNFIPGQQKQKPVSVYYKMPFSFVLGDSKKDSKKRKKNKDTNTNNK